MVSFDIEDVPAPRIRVPTYSRRGSLVTCYKTAVNDRRPKTVLVVDDETELLDLFFVVLEDKGYKIETATNGHEGLKAVERRMPDLIVVDIRMPVMDGPEFAREFHARYGFRVPLVVLTAAPDARDSACAMGAVGWMCKPFELNQLVHLVEEHIGAA